jgi:tetratricopeptide (TPR) repeat protein
MSTDGLNLNIMMGGLVYVSGLHIQQQGSTPTHEFLKFDASGQVCGIEIAFSSGSVDQVVEQFNTIPDGILLKGKYTVRGETLVFQLVSSQVVIDYEGRAMGDRLALHIHSRTTAYERDEVYWSAATRAEQLKHMARSEALARPTAPRLDSLQVDADASRAAALLNERAWECEHKGDRLGAILHFDKALQAHPFSHNSYYGRGVIYCKTRNYTMAIADLNRAIDLVPGFAGALTERGLAFVESGNLEQAMRDYDKAIRANPAYGLAHINMGSAYAIQGDWHKALGYLTEGIRLSPQADEAAYLNRATTYEQLGNIAAAIEDLNRYLCAYPQGAYVEHARKQLAALKKRAGH